MFLPKMLTETRNLPRSGSMRNGELFERPMLAPRIDGTGRSSWPTPRSEDSESCGNHPGAVDSLTGATRQWATPNCRDDHNPSTPDSPRTQRKLEQGWTIDLNEQAAWWQTPATDSFRCRGGDRKNEMGLDQQARTSDYFHPAPETPPHGSESLPTSPTSRRRLNPNFVDWLMSLPPGWTDYAPVETAWWYSRVRMRLESLLNARG